VWIRLGRAVITSPWTVEIDGEALTTRAIVIAAGAEPAVPPLPGLEEIGYLTSETVWKLEAVPQRLLILGGGPIGCELAQAFARLGAQVTLVQKSHRLLEREDDDVSAFVCARLRRDGVQVLTGHQAVRAERQRDQRTMLFQYQEARVTIGFDAVLVAVGRKPRTTGYGLEALDIRLAAKGTIETNQYLQTQYPNVLACGDVAGPFQFTHAAGHQG
jgi:pyruvate/2-oxoglutarate dehydrogenase complex dihydrolipoamide dehydrogenase (E3) component